ncbi:GNAT family N-acetyltransferase [Haladaptatus halobius]|uniref:GNAT family N-acetyltransferase n=1 Tax=Haladaptatus halobius TaxID=2884875 RepID=UPI001D09C5BB|nr:GNAT family protein [Haladaptatus halobius]
MFPERIETERLELVRFCREHFDALSLYPYYSRHSDTVLEETEHLTWKPHAAPKETRDLLADAEESWVDGDGAIYAVVPREEEDGAGEFAGVTGLHPEWDEHSALFGLWLRKPYWGRGYSGERAGALMKLAFDRLDLELVSAGYLYSNEKSRRAIEKYVEAHGGQYDGILRNWVPMDDEVRDLHRYTVTREQWEERHKESVTFVER